MYLLREKSYPNNLNIVDNDQNQITFFMNVLIVFWIIFVWHNFIGLFLIILKVYTINNNINMLLNIHIYKKINLRQILKNMKKV